MDQVLDATSKTLLCDLSSSFFLSPFSLQPLLSPCLSFIFSLSSIKKKKKEKFTKKKSLVKNEAAVVDERGVCSGRGV